MSINEEMVRNIVEAALLAAGEPVSLDRLVALFDPAADARAQRADADAEAEAEAEAGGGAEAGAGGDADPGAHAAAAGRAGDEAASGAADADVAIANDAFDVDGADASGSAAAPAVGREEVTAALAALAELYADRGLELREVASGWRVQVRADLAPWISRLWEARPPKYSRALLETLALIAYQQPVTRGDIENVRGVSVSSGIIRTLLDRDWIRIVGHRDVPGRPALYGTTRAFLDYFDLRSLDQLPPLAEIRDLARLNEEFGFDDADAADAGDEDGQGAETVPLRAVLGQFETPSDAGEFAEPEAEPPPLAAQADLDADVDLDADADAGSDMEADADAEADAGADMEADADAEAGYPADADADREAARDAAGDSDDDDEAAGEDDEDANGHASDRGHGS